MTTQTNKTSISKETSNDDQGPMAQASAVTSPAQTNKHSAPKSSDRKIRQVRFDVV